MGSADWSKAIDHELQTRKIAFWACKLRWQNNNFHGNFIVSMLENNKLTQWIFVYLWLCSLDQTPRKFLLSKHLTCCALQTVHSRMNLKMPNKASCMHALYKISSLAWAWTVKTQTHSRLESLHKLIQYAIIYCTHMENLHGLICATRLGIRSIVLTHYSNLRKLHNSISIMENLGLTCPWLVVGWSEILS